MTITSEGYVGIDVSKDKLDVAIPGQKTVSQADNTKRGIARLVKQMQKLNPKLIVVEATGGIKRFRVFDASQCTKPCIVNAHKMNDLVSDRPMGVAHTLRELLMG